MVLRKTVDQLKNLLMDIHHDLDKAARGNKAAAQRCRTNTIKFAKVAKVYRKESIAEGRKGSGKKKKASSKKTTRKKATRKKTAAKRKTTAKRKPAKKKTTRRKR